MSTPNGGTTHLLLLWREPVRNPGHQGRGGGLSTAQRSPVPLAGLVLQPGSVGTSEHSCAHGCWVGE